MIYAVSNREATEFVFQGALPECVSDLMCIVNAAYQYIKETDAVHAESLKKMISDPKAIEIAVSDDFEAADAIKYSLNKSIELGPDCSGLKDPAQYEEVKSLVEALNKFMN